MPTKSLDRLLFAQGGSCFFCGGLLSKAEASIEHLVARVRGGGNGDDNCVVCCKTLNALLGSMSLKEKIRVMLNQKGSFKCPGSENSSVPIVRSGSEFKVPKVVAPNIPQETIQAVIVNLRSRGNSRPRRMKTLISTIKAVTRSSLTDEQVEILIQELQLHGRLNVSGEQVTYKL